MDKTHRKPSLLLSLIPIIFLVGLLAANVFVFSDNASYGPNQMALIFAAALAGVLSLTLNFKWDEILDGIVQSISSAMGAILILLMIGSLAGTWLISGVVPAMIYYGLDILNPTIFLFAACIVSAVVSLATGSSWSTAATIGIALMGIGQALGIHEGVIAGAVISGAYFGDKMSPLSDTTNLAPAMAGTDLFTHIRYMALTTGPSITISLIIFLIWGFNIEGNAALGTVDEVQAAIASRFEINLFLFIVPAVVIFLIVKKVPALPALLIGTLLAVVFALIFQPHIVLSVTGADTFNLTSAYEGVMKAMFTSVSVETGDKMVDELLTASGMEGMLPTVWLIVCAMIFGGVLEKNGMLHTIAQSIIKLAHSTGSLVASTAGTCFTFNLTASDQYIAIVVPGRMFRQEYEERGLAPENLSRTLEDTGTVTSVLIPWNTCGAYQSSVLGVATLTYLPYCFFNLISPFMTIIFAYANIKIRKIDQTEKRV
ncbi:Na+/H+ antiporter NhaC [Fulvivirga imtechensis AK7]|uniref:Na+/H+ antiporter NhaC n=1 Tax=Fulvivirga imtechensis AK7 TaxID=1237149 RepID=L8JJM5_9BACT|nr:Na+/H+ antiporter NhaC [Fulvivirga imtechensis]ELR69111.1 Na+/H+ antiporter NhaC [Fulvivirga imtechensis AK7]